MACHRAPYVRDYRRPSAKGQVAGPNHRERQALQSRYIRYPEGSFSRIQVRLSTPSWGVGQESARRKGLAPGDPLTSWHRPAVSGALADYERGLAPITSASFLNPYTTPGFGDALKRVDSGITNQVNGMFAGAGRDLSPANTAALARGLAQGEGQLVANQYNANLADQLGALAAGYGAAGGLLSQLNQLGIGNEEAGIGAASSALGAQNYSPQQLLAIEAMQRAIPVDYLKSLGAVTTPIAGLGGQTNGATTATTQVPLGNQIAGGLLGGAGLLGKLGAFGSNGWHYGGPNALL